MGTVCEKVLERGGDSSPPQVWGRGTWTRLNTLKGPTTGSTFYGALKVI